MISLKFYMAKRLCKHVCRLGSGGYKVDFDFAFLLFLTSKMLVYFKVLCFFMEHGVSSNLYCTLVVTKNLCWLRMSKSKLMKKSS
jgi:hypothetical protein